MRDVLLVAATDLRRRVADPTTWLVAFVAPVALAVVIGLALGSAPHVHASLALVDADHGPVAAGLRAALAGPDLASTVTVREAPDAATASRWVRTGRVDAGLVVPAGASTHAGLAFRVESRDDRLVGRALAESLAEATEIRRDAALAGGAAGVDTIDRAIVVRPAGPDLPPAAFYGPAFAVLFALFLSGTSARQWVEERRSQLLARAVLLPVPAARIVAGKVLAATALVAASMTACLGTIGAVFGIRWGSWTATVVVIVATSIVLTGLAAATAVMATRDDQAAAAGTLLGFVLGVLGGDIVARRQLPAAVQTLSAITPNGWAGRAFDRLAVDGGGVASVAAPLAVLAAFAAVLAAVISTRSRKLLLP